MAETIRADVKRPRGRPRKDDVRPDDAVVQLSAFQQRVMGVPEEYDLFLGGGRGGGKSYTLALLALRHAEQYRERARILYLRQSHTGTSDFESLCLELFTRIYGRELKFNVQQGVFRFPSGGVFEINQLENAGDYAKYTGRSFTFLELDECGQYATPELLDRMRSNLRGPNGIPIRCVMAANPGDVGHQWIAKRYVFRAAPWVPFLEESSGRTFVYGPSRVTDNEFIDVDQYTRQLQAACATDPELLKAWLDGSWTVSRGAYFAAVIDEHRNAIDPWHQIPVHRGRRWEAFIGMDFGSSAPAVVYVALKSPGAQGPDGRWYARDSIVLVDELATNEPGDLNRGLGWTVPVLAEAIREMCVRWEIRPQGVADDAIFARTGSGAGSIADEFRRAGVYFMPAKKADRITGWNIMKRLLQDAGKPDVPGLYISRACEYAWSTLPYLARDPKRVEDLRSSGQPDHAADAVRYIVNARKRGLAMGSLQEFFNPQPPTSGYRSDAGWCTTKLGEPGSNF